MSGSCVEAEIMAAITAKRANMGVVIALDVYMVDW